jgi:threonine dehydratase
MLSPAQTPLIRLSNLFPDRQVYAKCEFLAPSGCFKIRGATHLLDHLGRTGQTRQLVVPSMGNTALGAATAARALGFAMVGVVPPTIARAKEEKLQAIGGVELLKVGGGGSALLHRARQVAAERGGYFVHPHLDPLWTDGYRAIAAEVLQVLPGCRSLVFPLGGGGLLLGLTEHLLQRSASVKLFACEAYNYPTYARFDHPRTATVADGLILEEPHAEVRQRIDALGIAVELVKDPDICAALAGLYRRQALVVEPSAAITVAFVQARVGELEEPVCVVLTGENITREDFHRLIAGAEQKEGAPP